MALTPLSIVIQAQNQSGPALAQITQQVQGVSGALAATQKSAANLQAALQQIQQGGAALKSVAVSAKDAAGTLGTATSTANGLGLALQSTSRGQAALGGVAGAAVGLARGLARASSDAATLQDKLGGLRTASVALKDAAGAGLLLSENFSKAAISADRLGAKVGTILKGSNLGSSIGEVKKLGEEIAAISGGNYGEISKEIARAVTTGRTRSLVEYGIVVDEQGEKAIAAAKKLGVFAGRHEVLNQVLKAGARAVSELKGETDESTIALGQLDVRMQKLSVGIGKGTSEAKAAILGGLLNPLLDVAEANPGLEKAGGMVLYVGSSAAHAAGGLLGLAQQVGLATLAFPGLAKSATAAFAAADIAALPLLATVGKIALVALAAAAALYLVDKALHAQEDAKLSANIKAGEGKDDQSLAILNAARKKDGLPAIQKYSGPVNPTETADPSDPTAQIAQLQATLSSSAAPAAPTAPAPEAAPALTSAPAGAPAGLPGLSAVSSSQSDMEGLEDRLSASTDRPERAGLREQLRLGRRAQKHSREAERAMTKEQHEAEREKKKREREEEKAHRLGLRNAGYSAAGDNAEDRGAVDEREEGLKAAGELAGFRDKRSLLGQLRVIKGETGKGGTLSKEDASARTDALKALYEARDKARKADLDEQISSLEAQKALSEAGAKASGLEGSAREAALRIGQAKAERIREVARMKAQLAREEAGDDEKTAREELAKHSGSKSNGLAALFSAQRLKGSFDLGAGGLATAGGGPLNFRGGNYGTGLPSFTGSQAQRLRDAASSQAAFSRLGLDRAGGNPREGGAQRGQDRTVTARATSMARDISGKLIVQFAPLVVEDAAHEMMSGPRRSR